MSKQLTLSAGLSVLAMLGLVLASTPAAAEDLGLGSSQLLALASACTSVIASDLLPILQAVMQ